MIELFILPMIGIQAAGQMGAPDKLVTEHGVELVADGRAFVLYAGLNGLGYDHETRRKGPPLQAPVYHELRREVRDALRKISAEGKLDGLKKTFEKNPAELDAYLALVLAHDQDLAKAEQKTMSPAAKKLAGTIGVFRTLSENPELVKLFDLIAEDQRNFMKSIKAGVEMDFELARKKLNWPDLRAPQNLTVIPNPLDAHAAVHRIQLGGQTYLVVGPGLETARRAILEASLAAAVSEAVKGNIAKAGRVRSSWDTLKISKRLVSRFPSAEVYLTETMARVLAFKVRGGDVEDFVDNQNDDGLRWTRSVLRAVDQGGAKAPMSEQLPSIVARVSP